MGIQIKKAKIKSHIFLEAEYSEPILDGVTQVKKDCTAPVHDDLKKAFRRLDIHLAFLCEQAKPSTDKKALSITAAFPDDETVTRLDPGEEFRCLLPDWHIINNTTCSGFSVGGNGETEGVSLFGVRVLSNGKKINIVTPFTKWADDYQFVGELIELIEECKAEVYSYLFENKHQPDNQPSLFEEMGVESITEIGEED